MRNARLDRARGRKSRVVTRPAPVGGWNARDTLDMMDYRDAIELINWFPDQTSVRLRSGHRLFSAGFGGTVETLAEYHSGQKRALIAAGNGYVYDAAEAEPESLGDGFANDRWQVANFGGEMALVNGTDAPQVYDGETLSDMDVTGPTDPSNLVGVTVYRNRSYFWETNSQNFWYSEVQVLGKTLTQFPLSYVGQFGGNLVTMETWTRDSGEGVDDLLVCVMSSGEIIVYSGGDPGADFSIEGVYQIGSPIGRRCAVKWGGDLIIITQDGYVSLSAMLRRRTDKQGVLSDKINLAVTGQIEGTGDQFGWQPILYPRGDMLLFNYPVSSGQFEQHVLNIKTGAWTKFRGLDGSAWAIYDDRLYFGGDGGVYEAMQGFSDDGANIRALGRTAFDYLGLRGQRKRVVGCRLVTALDGSVPNTVTVSNDFKEKITPQSSNSLQSSQASWDTAEWDEAAWAGAPSPSGQWRIRSGLGYNFSIDFRVIANGQNAEWFSTAYLFEPAGLL
ncbi:hypothetical protein [Salinisphaera sp.]|uniref:hypothetical protein n=1 Tax=Salinisphaera sp. TaxID=1914330 RepID=UPI000C581C18|nr:hypothetical protein [Salinisphaera sp.]MAS09922.1 hypothetical protein [Salinisphaera sp.]|tara:strand:+ start:1703 stop:3211 length:1509 start_codon:yes stop_codon:yes gene_type:complete